MTAITDENTIAKIEGAIAELRPFFEKDGGDIKLVEVSEDYIVKVELLGACKTCSMSTMTLKAGIEDAVKRVVPEVQGVEAIETEEVEE